MFMPFPGRENLKISKRRFPLRRIVASGFAITVVDGGAGMVAMVARIG